MLSTQQPQLQREKFICGFWLVCQKQCFLTHYSPMQISLPGPNIKNQTKAEVKRPSSLYTSDFDLLLCTGMAFLLPYQITGSRVTSVFESHYIFWTWNQVFLFIINCFLRFRIKDTGIPGQPNLLPYQPLYADSFPVWLSLSIIEKLPGVILLQWLLGPGRNSLTLASFVGALPTAGLGILLFSYNDRYRRNG